MANLSLIATIEDNVERVRGRIAKAAAQAGRNPDDVIVIGAAKTVNPEAIAAAHRAGIQHFGENWVQEAQGKISQLRGLDPPPTWHMIGHLQTNKVKDALELFQTIDTVDSIRLGEAIARRATHPIPILLEVNVAGEASKTGLLLEDVPAVWGALRGLPGLDIQGLMTVAPLVEQVEEVRWVFQRLRELRDVLGLRHLSMGMTDDFEVAIEEGATMVRIGRAIFGQRPHLVT